MRVRQDFAPTEINQGTRTIPHLKDVHCWTQAFPNRENNRSCVAGNNFNSNTQSRIPQRPGNCYDFLLYSRAQYDILDFRYIFGFRYIVTSLMFLIHWVIIVLGEGDQLYCYYYIDSNIYYAILGDKVIISLYLKIIQKSNTMFKIILQ